VAFAPDGKQVLTGSDDKTARLWDARGCELLCTFRGHSDSVSSVGLSPDGKQVLAGSSDKTARLWDAQSGKQLCTFEGRAAVILSVVFAPEGKQVLTGSDDKTAARYSVSGDKGKVAELVRRIVAETEKHLGDRLTTVELARTV
jgi:WD40 repeat protein